MIKNILKLVKKVQKKYWLGVFHQIF